jgi:hypothetical protein
MNPAEGKVEEEEAEPERNQHDTISFPWDEFQELYALVAEAMARSGRRGRSRAR